MICFSLLFTKTNIFHPLYCTETCQEFSTGAEIRQYINVYVLYFASVLTCVRSGNTAVTPSSASQSEITLQNLTDLLTIAERAKYEAGRSYNITVSRLPAVDVRLMLSETC